MSKSILGINIDEIIKHVISETFPNENEKSVQDSKTEELKQLKSGKKQKEDIDEDEEKTSVKASEVVELFNLMRSGKSLKDKEVRKNFQAYFDTLSGSERVALYSFSKAVSDIISGSTNEKEAAEQEQPEDFGVEVTKSKKKEKKEKTKKVSKDDSTPIVVGESANKKDELNLILSLK